VQINASDLPSSWEDPHQLVEGLERLAHEEGNLELFQLLQVRGEGGVVIGVVPGPGADALVVVAHHPHQPLAVSQHLQNEARPVNDSPLE
jgi:hypothetical protein